MNKANLEALLGALRVISPVEIAEEEKNKLEILPDSAAESFIEFVNSGCYSEKVIDELYKKTEFTDLLEKGNLYACYYVLCLIDEQLVAADEDCNLTACNKVVYISAIIDNDWNRQNENMFLLVNMMVQMVRGISLAKSGLASANGYLGLAQWDLSLFAGKIKEPGNGIDKLTKVIMFGEDFDTEIDSFIEETKGRIKKERVIVAEPPLSPHGTLLFSAPGGYPVPSLCVTTPLGTLRSSGLCEGSPPPVTSILGWSTGCPDGGCPATSAGSEGGSTFVFSHPSSAASPDAPRDARSEHQQRMLSPPRRLLDAAVATPDSSPGGLSTLTSSAHSTPGEGSPELGCRPESLGGGVARSLFRG